MLVSSMIRSITLSFLTTIFLLQQEQQLVNAFVAAKSHTSKPKIANTNNFPTFRQKASTTTSSGSSAGRLSLLRLHKNHKNHDTVLYQNITKSLDVYTIDETSIMEAYQQFIDDKDSDLLQQLKQHQLVEAAPRHATAAIKKGFSLSLSQQQWWKEFTKSLGLNDINKARLLLLGAAALYGTNFSMVKVMGESDTMSVGLCTTLRFGFAALATLPWLFRVDTGTATTTTEEYHSNHHNNNNINIIECIQTLMDPQSVEFQSAICGLEVGLWNSIGYVAQAVGLETSSASESAFLCSMAVVIVPILDFLSGKKILTRQVIGVILAVVGVAFLELGGDIATTADTGQVAASSLGEWASSLSYGDICTLIQPLAFGFGFWKMEQAMHKFPNQANRITGGQLMAIFISSAAYLIASSIYLDDSSIIPTTLELQQWLTDPVILLNLFWTGVITTALTIYMETVALKTLSAAETTLIFCTEPLWGTAFATILLGERLGMSGAMGAIFILFGCLFSNLGFNGLLSLLLPIIPPSAKQLMIQQQLLHQKTHQKQHQNPERTSNENNNSNSNFALGLVNKSKRYLHSTSPVTTDIFLMLILQYRII